MSSKLDEMRNQFRQRLAIRSETTSKTDVNKDYNQNIIKTDGSDSFPSNTVKIYPKSKTKIARNASDSSLTRKTIGTAFPLPQKNNDFSKAKSQELKNRSDGNPSDRLGLRVKANDTQTSNGNRSQTKRENRSLSTVKNRIGPDLNKTYVLSTSRGSDLVSDGTPCRYCGRSFALTERLIKHESVCDLSYSKSRKAFDSMKQRFKGLPNEYLVSYEISRNVCLLMI